jgi:tetratricopeptide (TPR) repeat protein
MKRLLVAFSFSLAWNLQIPGAIAAPASPASTPSTASLVPKNASLQKIYRKAMEAYDAKRYDEAVDLFGQVLSKQPDHTSSRIFLARSLYQQKNITEAFKTFQQIDIKLLEPDAAYDYGQVAYRSGDYGVAIKALAIVPNGHPLYDLAGYYAGISAYKLGEYQQSIDLFDQAVVLPSKLVRSQKLYRKEAEKKLLAKQRHELQSGSVSSTKDNRPSPQAATPVSFVLNPERAITLSHRYMNQTSETKKALSTEYDLSRSRLDFEWGSADPAATAKSQWVYLGKVSGMTTHDGEQEIPILPTPEETLQFLALSRYKPKTMMRLEIGGGYESQIGDRSTIGAQVGAYAYAPDSDFAKGLLVSPYISVFVAQKGEAIETELKAEAHPRFDDGELLVTQSVQEGQFNFNLTKSAYVGLSGELNEYSYNTERLSGPDWNGRFLFSVGYRQEKSLSLSIGAFYEIAQGWRIYDADPAVPLMKFNLSQSGAFAKADMHLTSWWTVGINGKIANNAYSNPVPVGAEAYLDEHYGSKLSQFALYTSLTKSF